MDDTSPLFGTGLRQPPANVEAEVSLLGARRANNTNLEAGGDLREEHFTGAGLGAVFTEIRTRVLAGRHVDAVSLKDRFDNKLLASCVAAHVSNNVVPEYARVIIECAARRRLIEIYQRGIDEAHGNIAPAEIVASVATAQIEASPAIQTAPGMFGRLRVLSMGDIVDAPPRDYLLKGIMSPGELSVWWGEPKCGKSFLLLHVAYAVAQDRDVFGRRVKGCPVLYVAAEGAPGLARRVQALRDRFGDAPDFHLIAQPVDLLHPFGDVANIIAAAKHVKAGLIVLDTFNRMLAGGDENGPQDMGAMVKNIGEIRCSTEAHIAAVHHGTKDGKTPRGHTSLIGAADAVVEVAKAGDGSRTATLTMAKDDADGVAMGIRLRVVEMGTDDDGDPITTCIVDEMEKPASIGPVITRSEGKARQFLADLIVTEGKPLPVGCPDGLRGVAEDRWRDECESRRLSTAEKRDDRRRAFSRAFEGLMEKAIVGTRDGIVWLAHPPGPGAA